MLLDVNETMTAHLADAKLALKSQVTSKILFNKQDVLGIGLVGTEGTDNMVHDEMGEGEYEHVSVVKQVAKATFSSLAALDAAACSGASGDLIDGVVVAVDAVTKFVRKLKFGKRVILVTDGSSYVDSDADGLDQIAEGMAAEGIRFTVLGVGLSADVKAEGGGNGASAREQFMRCLGRFREKLGDRFELRELSELLRQGQPGSKEVKPTKAFQGALQIGSLMALPVICWRRVSKGAPIKFCNVSKAALADDDADADADAEAGGEHQRKPDQTVATERRYCADSQPDDEVPADMRHHTSPHLSVHHHHTQYTPLHPLRPPPTAHCLPPPLPPLSQVPPEMRQAAYTYGKDMVPVTSQDEEAMKFGVAEKCMQLVGMVPQATRQIPHTSRCPALRRWAPPLARGACDCRRRRRATGS